MKVAVVYNPDAKGIINVFGIQNREWYPKETIQKAVRALEKGGHEVELIPGDRFLLTKLKKFLPNLSKRRANGIVLNMALGIQGKCRYTHVPAILEAAGIPYTGSSPMGHILALDKVIAKQVFIASGLPTPNHQVFSNPDQRLMYLQFPLIVKPRGEAASFGLRIARDEEELKVAVDRILMNYKQTALVEEFINGREISVGILGNNPPEALPVLELILEKFNDGIYSHEAKFAKSARKSAEKVCPADLPPETTALLQDLAVQAFESLNIYDFARVDFRLDRYNRPFILEVNSMASLNPNSSFVHEASKAGYSYARLINRIVEVACERYAAEEPDYFNNEHQATTEHKKGAKKNNKRVKVEPKE
ncbi:MAG: ATP-grasp domain-containing protein [bacterium]|nr:MAG: ATP-grasp domain-containing protein [bacterium]